jgi:hypothetical protein
MSAESGKKNEVWKKGLPGESGVQCYPDLTLSISYRHYKQKVEFEKKSWYSGLGLQRG